MRLCENKMNLNENTINELLTFISEKCDGENSDYIMICSRTRSPKLTPLQLAVSNGNKLCTTFICEKAKNSFSSEKVPNSEKVLNCEKILISEISKYNGIAVFSLIQNGILAALNLDQMENVQTRLADAITTFSRARYCHKKDKPKLLKSKEILDQTISKPQSKLTHTYARGADNFFPEGSTNEKPVSEQIFQVKIP